MQNNYLDKFNFWLNNAKDEDVVSSLKQMQGDAVQIESAFYKELEFGTAGLRGIMGAGTNRLNVYTIIQTTKAIATYVNTLKEYGASVVITYDSRINSERFAKVASCVLASNGIKAYLTNGCKPTPYLSYLVKNLSCNMGINITSSHNPKEYNGYKVYEENGCQIGEEVASIISNIKNEINPFEEEFKDFECLLSGGLIEYVDEELENSYINAVYGESLLKQVATNDLKVVYSALNGVGYSFVKRILEKIKQNNVILVSEQIEPNGNFTTCPYPNPEKIEAFSLALEYARGVNADLIFATDPDSDRLGVVVVQGNDFIKLSGNEVGLLLCDFILRTLKAKGELPSEPILIKSIVTSPLVDNIVKAYGGKVIQCYTGFKNIGNEIIKLEQKALAKNIVFAYEESCGYLKGTYAKDKDGIVASMLICELASELKVQGKTLCDRLNEIKAIYGNYENETISIKFDGVLGEKKKNEILSKIHNCPPKQIAGENIVKVVDFLNKNEYNLPSADVVKWYLQSGDEILIRPSGTEPLIKCYITVKNAENQGKMKSIIDAFNNLCL
ncbi:MAG: phospho-sugar mutase [Christensenellales bacterium]